MATISESQLSPEDVMQIDCNNPDIDWAVVARTGEEQEISLTRVGSKLMAVAEDKVPFGCPLLIETDQRTLENFLEVCRDCVYSNISLVPQP
jgi:hypothetical protein